MMGWGITRSELIELYKEQGFPLMKDGTPYGMDAHILEWVRSNDVVRIGDKKGMGMAKYHLEPDDDPKNPDHVKIVIDEQGPVPRFCPVDTTQRGGILFFRPTEEEFRRWEKDRLQNHPDDLTQEDYFDQVEYVVVQPKSFLKSGKTEPEFHRLNGNVEARRKDAEDGLIMGVVFR